MDYDDAVPPPIRRGSRSAPRQTLTLDLYEPLEDLHIEDSDSDDAAPPPIRLRKSESPSPAKPNMSTKPPLPSKNPLRSRADPPKPTPRSTNFSHPMRTQPQSRSTHPVPNRKPSRTISYRSNPRLPPTLRRCSSLETIDSVTTTTSVDNEDVHHGPEYPDFEESPLPSPYYLDEIDSSLATPTSLSDSLAKPSPLFSHQRFDSATTAPAVQHQIPRQYENPRQDENARQHESPRQYESSHQSKTLRQYEIPQQYESPQHRQSLRPYESAASEPDYREENSRRFVHVYPFVDEDDGASAQFSLRSERSSDDSSDRTSTQTTSTSARPSLSTRGSSSMLRRLKPKRMREPLLTPQHLEIEKTVEFDQSSQRTNSSSSIATISSGRPSELGIGLHSSSSASQRSQSSRNWKASSFDINTLSEAELKKCKKKGINPALYAEMKAARKGKFVSPIGGNTFL